MNRRQFLKTAAIAASSSFIAPQIGRAQKTIRLGFIALTDSASLIMAKELGYTISV